LFVCFFLWLLEFSNIVLPWAFPIFFKMMDGLLKRDNM
jgi:hypothetical protein